MENEYLVNFINKIRYRKFYCFDKKEERHNYGEIAKDFKVHSNKLRLFISGDINLRKEEILYFINNPKNISKYKISKDEIKKLQEISKKLKHNTILDNYKEKIKYLEGFKEIIKTKYHIDSTLDS